MGTTGIKETKDLLIALNEVALVLVQRFKDGIGVEDFAAFYEKLKNDSVFKAELEAAWENHGMIPAEIKDIDLGEAVELVFVQASYLPKFIDAVNG